MKKRVFGRKLSRDRDSRKALIRGLIASLVKYGKITTTKAKAKTIQSEVDQYLTDLREDTIAARRRIQSNLGNDTVTTKLLFQNYLKITAKRTSGFTRIINLPRRKGDSAEIVTISFVDEIKPKKKKVKENAKNNTAKKS
ncbi:MAG: 50S ribosomal protein L17 [Candidatus Woesebacteria bacterium]|nr:MAG: 50S ribosomal protein L17 [Candidatus Woesebacteria bacterium]